MLIHAAQPLFAWGEREDCPTLATIREALATLPDQQLVAGLVQACGHGRDDYPVQRLWHIVLLTILLRHHSCNDCLAELHRNPSLCRFIGITNEDQIPNSDNLSRFLDVLGQHTAFVETADGATRFAVREATLGQPTAGTHFAGQFILRRSVGALAWGVDFVEDDV